MDIRISSVTDSAIVRDSLRKGKTPLKKTTPLAAKGVSWETGKRFGEEQSEPGWLDKILRDFNDIVSLFDVHLRFFVEKTSGIL